MKRPYRLRILFFIGRIALWWFRRRRTRGSGKVLGKHYDYEVKK